MAEFRDIKRRIVEESVRQGRSVATGPISNEWVKGLERQWRVRYREIPRLVNRFTIGARVMVGARREGELRASATVLGGFARLHQATRSVMVTAKGSRRVLEVVGNLAFGLQGADVLSTHSGAYSWESGGWLKEGFPLSGRVGFARLRTENRLREVVALDEVMELLISAGVFSREEQKLRNTWPMAPVGLLGDWKKQSWGWEYRGFPSFVESPAQAMLVLTLTKLAVVRPDLIMLNRTNGDSPEYATHRIKMFLAYFRGLDDDAELCWEMIRRHGLPKKPRGMNTAWGITFLPKVERKGIGVVAAEAPKGIQAKIWAALVENTPIPVIGGYESLMVEIPKGWKPVGMVPMVFRGTLHIGEHSNVVAARLHESEMEAPTWWAQRQRVKIARLGLKVKSKPSYNFVLSSYALKRKLSVFKELLCDGSIGVWKLEDVMAGRVREPQNDGRKVLFEKGSQIQQ